MKNDGNPAPENICVCLPTYNESHNLPPLVREILQYLPQAKILVIDDNSPDGTGTVAEELARQEPRLAVHHRPRKEGLGKAYLDGFKKVLAWPGTEVVVQMDADRAHPPARLPALLEALDEADLVLGSRYVGAGGVVNWGLHRRLLSRFGSAYARFWLRVPLRDLTGGFKIWRRWVLEKIVAQPIHASGYAFLVETTYIASRMGARIREVPFLFTERDAGASKMTLAIALEAFLKVPLMAWRHRHVSP